MSKGKKERKPWSERFGFWGSSIRIAERGRGGPLYLHWVGADGNRQKRSLGHKDKAQAKLQAMAFAESLRVMQGNAPVDLTVGALIDIYFANGLKGRAKSYIADKQRQLQRWKLFLGESRKVCSLSPSDVDKFVVWRKEASHSRLTGKTLWHDWKALDIALNFGTKERDANGKWLLEVNPLKGRVQLSKTTSPMRPVATAGYFSKLWEVGVNSLGSSTLPSGLLAKRDIGLEQSCGLNGATSASKHRPKSHSVQSCGELKTTKSKTNIES